jgi:hypothetical protein
MVAGLAAQFERVLALLASHFIIAISMDDLAHTLYTKYINGDVHPEHEIK